MPGLNQHGPEGQGPKTGRGLGKCNPDFNKSELDQMTVAGRGRGKGRGMGRWATNAEAGRGRGWRAKGRGNGRNAQQEN